MVPSTSYRLIELVRAHIGTPYVKASDTDAARALGLTRAAISDYKHGRSRMSAGTAARAIELLGTDGHEATDLLRQLMNEQARTEPERSIWRLLAHAAEAFGGKAAALAMLSLGAALLAAGLFLAGPENAAFAALFGAPMNIHYAYLLIAGAALLLLLPPRWRRFLCVFPAATFATSL